MEAVQDKLLAVVLVILTLSVIWVAFRYIKFYKTEHLVCPKCMHSWKPPLQKIILATNAAEGIIVN